MKYPKISLTVEQKMAPQLVDWSRYRFENVHWTDRIAPCDVCKCPTAWRLDQTPVCSHGCYVQIAEVEAQECVKDILERHFKGAFLDSKTLQEIRSVAEQILRDLYQSGGPEMEVRVYQDPSDPKVLRIGAHATQTELSDKGPPKPIR